MLMTIVSHRHTRPPPGLCEGRVLQETEVSPRDILYRIGADKLINLGLLHPFA